MDSIEKNPSGFLLVYKPRGFSSFDIVRMAKKTLQTRTIGHAGTLDPLAEGLLLLGVNAGTKALSDLLLAKKTYLATIFFGASSSTGDEEGEKVFHQGNAFSQNDLEKIFPDFLGKIEQMPPLYSALKIKGKRACDRVRNGEIVILAPRTIEIFSLRVDSFEYPVVKLFIECGSGTYIRSLVQDLGERMGTGGYLQALVRDSLGYFSITEAVLPEEISWESVRSILPKNFSIPSYSLSAEQKKYLFFGQRIAFPKEKNGKCALFCDGRWFGFGKVEEGLLVPVSLIGEEKEGEL